MNIVLIIDHTLDFSKQSFHWQLTTALQKNNLRQYDLSHFHIDHLKKCCHFTGYMPGNYPSFIFINLACVISANDWAIIKLLYSFYPHEKFVFYNHINFPTNRSSFHIPSAFHFIYEKSEEAVQYIGYILMNSKTKHNKTKEISVKDYMPLKESFSYFKKLTVIEDAFSLRYDYSDTFPSYQFFVCYVTSNNTNSYGFPRIYIDVAAHISNFCAYRVDSNVSIFIFFDITDRIAEFSNFRKHDIIDSNKIFPHLHDDSAAPITLVAGSIHTGLWGVYKSYFESKETFYVNKLYRPSVSFEDISSLSNRAAKPLRLIELERMIRNNLEYNKGTELIHYVKLWFQECRSMGYALENVKMDLLNLYSSIKYVIFDMYTLRETRIKYGLEVYELIAVESPEELEEWFYTWICYTLNVIHTRHNIQHMRINDALEFIEYHLMENISLKSVSSYFFLNPSYFSTIFKKEMNETFMSYVTRLKMQKAAELLLTDRKVTEVARLLGYDDMKHFRTTFRKYFDASPSEYKQKLEA